MSIRIFCQYHAIHNPQTTQRHGQVFAHPCRQAIVLPSRPVDAPTATHPRPAPTHALAARGLRCVRGDRTLFESLEFGLSPGGILQIEGPNGSGKTTLLRAVCGLTPIDAGDVLWHGIPRDEAADQFLGALTYVGHIPAVKRDLTPRENLAAWRALANARLVRSADDAFARVGLTGFGDTPLRHLSAGQARRVALARLLALPTPLWLLDEPLTALDADGKALLETLLTEHAASGGMALISTHHGLDLTTAAVQRLQLEP